MEEVKNNMNELFDLAKNAQVDYTIENVTAVIGTAATTGAVGAASLFKLSKTAIMLGSTLSVSTVAVLVLMNGEDAPVKTESTQTAPVEQSITEEPIVSQVIPLEEEDIQEQVIVEETEVAEYANFVEVNEVLVPETIETIPEAIYETPVIPEPVAETVSEDGCNCPASSAAVSGFESFHSVNLNLPISVELVYGNSPSVKEAHGNDEIFELLDLNVSNGVLSITMKDDVKNKRKSYKDLDEYHLVLEMAEIKQLIINGSGDIYSTSPIPSEDMTLMLNGSGDISLKKASPKKLVIEVRGSGDVEVYGADNSGAKEGRISVYGSGDVCTRYLDIADLEVNISGSADLKVHASKELEVNINGSGEVCYYGEANVTSNVSGSGEIYSCE